FRNEFVERKNYIDPGQLSKLLEVLKSHQASLSIQLSDLKSSEKTSEIFNLIEGYQLLTAFSLFGFELDARTTVQVTRILARPLDQIGLISGQFDPLEMGNLVAAVSNQTRLRV